MEKLQTELGYQFKDKKLLEVALTHSSFIKENSISRNMCNERLEFLGDSILNAIVSEELFKRLKNNEEGKLTKIKSDIVCKQSLADIARKIHLGEYLIMGKGEIKSKSYLKDSILENAMEAVVGAIFLESGFEVAKDVIINLFDRQIENAISGKLDKDYKSAIQEISHKKHKGDISYILIDEKGKSHDKTFTVNLYIGEKLLGTGVGKSKKSAENMAAKEAIDKI